MSYKLVCLNCQKAFNLSPDYIEREKQSLKCPECRELAVYFPHRFRPPKKADSNKWAVVKYLYDNGFTYQHISNQEGNSYVKYPETMTEAKEFVEKYKR